MKYYKIITYGCQMNVHESEKLAGALVDSGYTECDDVNDASVVVFNTCCVRETAEQKAFGNIGALKKMKKERPNIIIAVCGCMTQNNESAQKLQEKFPFVDIIFGTHNINSFKQLLHKRMESGKRVFDVWENEKDIEENLSLHRTSGVNAWINIMYGCNNFCTYCIVPYVRGRERSRQAQDIIDEAKSLIAQGYKELTLLGQNVNSYGNDLEGGVKFYTLLEQIANLPGDFRLRFMTSHPKDFNEELIKVVAQNHKICKSIHLPVQSGSDIILDKMNRKYTAKQYLEKIRLLKQYIPNCGITSDLMVGFPGETNDDFNDTLNLVKQVEYSGCYTFIYSKRSRTPAAEMQNQVSEEIKKQRIVKLLQVQNEITRKLNKQFYLNNVFEILVDGVIDKKINTYCGRTDTGRLVSFESDKKLMGHFVNVKITRAATSSLFGVLV